MASNYSEYSGFSGTRVAAGEHRAADPIGGTQPIPRPREGLLEGLSAAQLIAGAAAAATSVLLASKIGIYGSVIGAAVSSIVTVVATQVYRRALTAGARKLSMERPAAARDEVGEAPAPVYANGARAARVAPTKLQARAAAQRAGIQRRVALASIAVAALAVALSAGAIAFATAGEGLGERTQPIIQAPAAPGDEDGGAPETAPSANGDGAAASAGAGGAAQGTGTSSAQGTTSSGTGTSDGTAAGGGSATGSGDGADTGGDSTGNGSDSPSDAGTGDTSGDASQGQQTGTATGDASGTTGA